MIEKKQELVDKTDNPSRNPDPITGAPGSHPVGTGIGAASAGTVGAVIGGVVGGPIGGAVGAAIGGVVGGLAGKGVAEQVNPTVEDAYWREHYASSAYVPKGSSYDLYQPAYRYGWESRSRYIGKKFEEVEPELAKDWKKHPANSTIGWDRASFATRDAWNRIDTDKTKKATL